MKLLLTGYEKSKRILPISSYLLSKYVPGEFDIKFLNYGDYNGKLYRGEFVRLDSAQFGGKNSWSKYLHDYIKGLNDKYVILGMDDHLIGHPVNMDSYNELLKSIKDDIKCIRLSDCNFYDREDYDLSGNIMTLHAGIKYLITGQYALWERNELLRILERTKDVWDFESTGSSIFTGTVIAHRNPPFKYDDRSALSGGREVSLNGVCQEDLDFLEKECLINHNLTLRE